MAAALNLGRRGLGQTSPNPAVGALVVKDGVIVGRGFTQPARGPHAEAEAIRDAGNAARGATLYVTLEPCNHDHGHARACTQLIIEAGLVRVVSAIEDPDKRVAGSGHQCLRDAGLEVVAGVLAEEARRANLGHILRVTEGRPMLTLKLAQTADLYAAGADDDPRLMITGEAANAYVHVVRAMHDAILVGIGTVLADDPQMNVRLAGMDGKKLLRVVLDTHLRMPLAARLIASVHEAPVLIVAGADASVEAEARLKDAGADVMRVSSGSCGLDLSAVLKALAQRRLTRVFSEGGPRVGAALIEQGFADEVGLFTSPKRLERQGYPALSATARAILADPARYRAAEHHMIGADRLDLYHRIV
ncbi:bifunctional diaminohydroxyphosphoribosylaminopyrimidine deaminase/5-amino-6-(5-phosphoribosylamino)uracil reductase RibD [Methylovirgula sp. 4M-Z18]|nr:bifunctional diaminohydroxyphosphoribosylaminopyrimidine deaminase/5-amino-6-(5-phosphoribosylamino)uracil reductase RibD [Methylovirgula sp. 4M-Z18]